MHEASLAGEIAAIIERRAEPDTRATSITLEIGELACVEREALLFALSSALASTCAADATVHIVSVPARARCTACAAEQSVEVRFEACEACGSTGLHILQGDELRVRSIVLEPVPSATQVLQ